MSEIWQTGLSYRLAKRNGEIVLQSLWFNEFTGEQKWLDVPTVELPAEDASGSQSNKDVEENI